MSDENAKDQDTKSLSPAAQSAQPAPAQPAQTQPPQPAQPAQTQPQQGGAPSASYMQQPASAQAQSAAYAAQSPQLASPASAAPQVVFPAPLTKLTGGMKFGWFVIGALLGIPGILIAWLANADKFAQVKNEAIKFSVIGMIIWAVLWVAACMIFLGIIVAATTSSTGMASSYYYGTYF